MYHLAAKILKIDPGISKIEPKQDIWKESTRKHGKFILWKKLEEKVQIGAIQVKVGGKWRKLTKNG